MKPSSPARKTTREVWGQTFVDQDDSDHRFAGRALATAYAGSNGFHSSPQSVSWLGLLAVEDAFRLNVDLGAGQIGCETHVLAFLTDCERELVVGH